MIDRTCYLRAVPLLAGITVALATLGSDAPSIDWTAPPSCPQRDELERRVERFDADAEPRTKRRVQAEGRVRGEGDRHVLELRIERWAEEGRRVEARTLRSASCDALTDAAALLIAVAADPLVTPAEDVRAALAEAGVEIQRPDAGPTPSIATPIDPAPAGPTVPGPPASGPTGDQPPTSSSSPPSPTATASPSRPSTTTDANRDQPTTPPADPPFTGGHLAGFAWIASGPLPRAQPGAEVEGGPRWGRWTLRLGAAFTAAGRYSLDADTSQPSVASAGATGWFAIGRIRGCGDLWRRGRIALPLCAGLESGAVVARGYGLDEIGRTALPWVAGNLGTDLVVRLAGPAHLVIGAEGFVGPLRPVLTVGGVDAPLVRGTLGGVRGRLGVHFEIPRR